MNLNERWSRTVDGSIDYQHLGIEESWDYVVQQCSEAADFRQPSYTFDFFLGQAIVNRLREEGLTVTLDTERGYQRTTVSWSLS